MAKRHIKKCLLSLVRVHAKWRCCTEYLLCNNTVNNRGKLPSNFPSDIYVYSIKSFLLDTLNLLEGHFSVDMAEAGEVCGQMSLKEENLVRTCLV